MKSYAPILIAFLLGVFVVSGGWGSAIYSALLLIGFITLVVLGALVWNWLDRKKSEADEHPKVADHEKDPV